MTTDILELPEVMTRISPLTVEEYHRLGEFNQNHRRTELIRGIIIEKVSKSPLHGSISKAIYDRLLMQIPSDCIVRRDDPLTLFDSEPEPDIAVVRGSMEDYRDRHPRTAEFVVEVAVSSVRLDRMMAAIYAENGVKEYWIVLARQRAIEAYRDLRDGVYRETAVFNLEQEAISAVLPQIRIPLSEIFTHPRP
jgi:Uma2 family endonuclease